jgi:integrase
MASISFDATTGWWSCRYYAGPDRGRIKKSLCKHPAGWSKSKPPRKPPPEVRDLARPFEEIERRARRGESIPSAALPLEAHVRGYVADFARTHRPNSTRCLTLAADRFLAFCAARKVGTVQGVSPSCCAAWVAARLAEGARPSTVRTERAYLARIWSRGRRLRVVAENPWDAAPVEGARAEATPKHWTAEELVTLIGVLDGWLKDWVVLDANTGLRVSALLGLRWRDVDLGTNRLTVPPELSKGGRPYSVPLTPAANEALARRLAAAGDAGPDAWIFASPRTGRPYSRGNVRSRIGRAVGRAGIRDFGHYCHAIRHSFAVALVDADVSIRVIQALLGHATIRTTEIYARLAAGKAEQVMGGFEIRPRED